LTRYSACAPGNFAIDVAHSFLQDYIQTLGVNFMEKKVSLRNTQITFSIWDLGGQKEFISMLPLVCNESAVMLFLFDLTRPATLASVKEWYRQVRTHNKTAIPFLVGTHFDAFAQQPPDAQVLPRVLIRPLQRCLPHAASQAETVKTARKYAAAMKAPLVFTSASLGVNIQKLFKVRAPHPESPL
jgi:GTP-binding protein of the ras superfamily involved in termination of M-phase